MRNTSHLQEGLSKSEAAAIAGVRIMKKGWATTGEAGKVLGVTASTALRYVTEGKLDGYQIGGRTRVTIESLRRIGASLPPPSTGYRDPPPFDSNLNDIGDYYD
jgi:excisionase family DNA binding protein